MVLGEMVVMVVVGKEVVSMALPAAMELLL
jgi:hypothetical protein